MEGEREYAVVLPLDALPVPIERATWPLHVTLVGNLRSSAGLDLVVGVLREAARAIPVLETTVREPAWFGPDGRVLVDLVDPAGLRAAHEGLLDALETYAGAVPLAPAYQREGYRPHVTASPLGRVRHGQRLMLGTVALVEIAPDDRADLAVPVAVFDLASDARPDVPAAMAASSVIELHEALTAAQVRHWVIGGWGVDALVGARTREHHDLDVLVDVEDLPVLLGALDGLRMTVRYLWSENRWLPGWRPSAFVADGPLGELDVHVVAMRGDRPLPLSASTLTFPSGALDAVGTIAGVAVPCAGAEAQLLMHSGYELPPAHRTDVERLRSLPAG